MHPTATPALLAEATRVHEAHHPARVSFAKCVFLSWYCSLGDCTFCYRSTIKQETIDPAKARRRIESICMELFLARSWNLELEFLTGGYGIYPIKDTVEICKLASLIMGEKIWVNFGVMGKPVLEQLKPYVKGVVASIESIHPDVRKQVCPSKPMEGYVQLFKNAGSDFEKSAAFIVGIGETADHLELLHDFIREHQLSRMTFFELQPVKGTPFTEGPPLDYYAWWIAQTRIAFPEIEIVAGISAKRPEDTATLLRAGANIITKFPIMNKFGTPEAKLVEEQLKATGRTCATNMSIMPQLNWAEEIDKLSIDERYKEGMLTLLPTYLKRYERKKLVVIQ